MRNVQCYEDDAGEDARAPLGAWMQNVLFYDDDGTCVSMCVCARVHVDVCMRVCARACVLLQCGCVVLKWYPYPRIITPTST